MFAGPRNMPGYLLITELLGSSKQRGSITGLVWVLWATMAASLAPLAFGIHILYKALLSAGAQNSALGELHPGSHFLSVWASELPCWKLLCVLVGVLEAFPLFLPRSWLCDSPRFLLARGDEEKARQVLRTIAQANGRQLPESYSFADLPISKSPPSESDGEAVGSAPPAPSPGGYWRLISGEEHLGRPVWLISLVACSAYFAAAFVFYGLTLASGTFTSNLYLSFFISTAMQIPAYALNGSIMEWLGRRGTMLYTLLTGGGACLAFVFLPKDSLASTVGAFAAVLAITVSFSAIYPYTVELFPTSYRGAAFAICQFTARMASILAPLVPSLGSIYEPLPLMVYGVVAIVSAVSILLLPETRGIDLKDT